MAKFKIAIREVSSTIVEVEAETEDDALDIVQDRYEDGDYATDLGMQYFNVDFDVV